VKRVPGRRLKPLLVVATIVVVVAALGYAYASPYLVLGRLKQAIDARDAQAVSEYVDFPALRASLRQQLNEELTRRIGPAGNPLAVLGGLIGSVLIGPLVDVYATPQGVAALMSGFPPQGRPGERPPEWSEPPAGAAHDESGGQTPTPGAASVSAAPGPSGGPAQTQAGTLAPPQRSAGYRNLNEFVVTYQRDADGARYAAIFRRDGLFSWKLSAVDLHK
jgi:MFS family permease